VEQDAGAEALGDAGGGHNRFSRRGCFRHLQAQPEKDDGEHTVEHDGADDAANHG